MRQRVELWYSTLKNHSRAGFLKISYHATLPRLHLLPRIYFAERPLRRFHLMTLEMTKDRATNRQMQAGWANKAFCLVIAEILGNLQDLYVLQRVRLATKPLDELSQKTGLEDAQVFLKLCVTMAGQRAWTMMVHNVCQPDSWLGVIDENIEERRSCFTTMKRDVNIITTAWKFLQERDPGVDVEAGSFKKQGTLIVK